MCDKLPSQIIKLIINKTPKMKYPSNSVLFCRKYEEIMPPAIEEFVYITDDTYNKRQVLRMEHLILKVLGFDLSVPTPLTFITAMCVTNKLTEETMYLAMVCI